MQIRRVVLVVTVAVAGIIALALGAVSACSTQGIHDQGLADAKSVALDPVQDESVVGEDSIVGPTAKATASDPEEPVVEPTVEAESTAEAEYTAEDVYREEMFYQVRESLEASSGFAGGVTLVDPEAIEVWWKGDLPREAVQAIEDASPWVTVTAHTNARYTRAEMLMARDLLSDWDEEEIGAELRADGPIEDGSGLHVEISPGASADQIAQFQMIVDNCFDEAAQLTGSTPRTDLPPQDNLKIEIGAPGTATPHVKAGTSQS